MLRAGGTPAVQGLMPFLAFDFVAAFFDFGPEDADAVAFLAAVDHLGMDAPDFPGVVDVHGALQLFLQEHQHCVERHDTLDVVEFEHVLLSLCRRPEAYASLSLQHFHSSWQGNLRECSLPNLKNRASACLAMLFPSLVSGREISIVRRLNLKLKGGKSAAPPKRGFAA